MPDINYLAVVLAAIAAWLVGAVWYTTLRKLLMAALGKTREELMGLTGMPAAGHFVLSFIAELGMAKALVFLMVRVGPVTIANGIAMGFLIWIGFIVTSMIVNHGYSRVRPMLIAIDGGHWLAVLLVQGAVIGAFGS